MIPRLGSGQVYDLLFMIRDLSAAPFGGLTISLRSSFGFAQDGVCVHPRLGLVVPRLYMVSGFKDFGVYSSSFVVADYEFFVRLCAFLLGVTGARPIE